MALGWPATEHRRAIEREGANAVKGWDYNRLTVKK